MNSPQIYDIIMDFSHSINIIIVQIRVLRKLPGDLFGLKIFYQHMQIIHDFITKKIEQHRATVDPHNVRDYIDAYLIEMERRKDEPPGSHFFFGVCACVTPNEVLYKLSYIIKKKIWIGYVN